MIVAVIQAVEVGKPSAPACPLLVAYWTPSKGRHPNAIGIKTITEVEVLYVYLKLSCRHAISDIPVLTDGGK